MTEINPYDPPKFSDDDSKAVDANARQVGPSGIGGWLILIAIGLVVSPLRLGGFVLTYLPMFSDGTWEALTSPGSPQYHPFWAPLLTYELVGNLGFAIGYIFLAVMFFRKSRLFPKAFIAIALVNVCFVTLDAWLATLVLPNQSIFDPGTLREILRSLISTAIWVPYMMVSKRVKNTFVS